MARRRTSKSDKPGKLDLADVLFRSVEPGVIVVDAARQVVAFSPAAERLARVPAAEVVGRSMNLLPQPLWETIDETLTAAQPINGRPIILSKESRSRTVLRANTFFLPDREGRPTLVLLVLHDLSTARELERKIERLQRLASQGILSAGVAHEIKNALVAIKSFAELLLEKGQDTEMVSLVVQETNRINFLVSQLLRLAGPAQPVFTEVHIHQSIDNALRLIKHQLKDRSIELKVALEAANDVIRGDARQLEQALINLLLNAVEAMGERGRLTLATELVFATDVISKFEPRARHPSLQIAIQDTGSGLPPQVLSNLFEPFLTTKPGGTGLGLPITRRIVQAHGGRISVESEPHRGTAFLITLPLAPRGPAES